MKNGVITVSSSGLLVDTFSIEFIPHSVVTTITPTQAVIGEQTEFTVTGEYLRDYMTFHLEDCSDIAKLSGDENEQIFSWLESWFSKGVITVVESA